jgi:hypothetical protein
MMSRPIQNRYAGRCHICRAWVDAEVGFLADRDPATLRWMIECETCSPWFLQNPRLSQEGGGRRAGPASSRSTPPPRPTPVDPCLRLLGLTPPVDEAAIRSRFRALAHAEHPDHGGLNERFIMIRNAYADALRLVGVER